MRYRRLRRNPQSPVAARLPNVYPGYDLRQCCMADLIVKSAVQNALRDQPVAADFYDALDEEVAELLEAAARRAEANDRRTVQPRDL